MNVVEKRKNWENKVSWYKKNETDTTHKSASNRTHITNELPKKCFIFSNPLGENEVQKELNKESIDVCVRLYYKLLESSYSVLHTE